MFCLSPLYLQLLIKSKSYFICSWKGLRSQEVRSQASGSQLWGKAKVQVIQVMATAHCIAVAPQNFVNNWSFLCETNRVAFFLVLGQFSLQYGSVPHWGGKTWRGMIGGSVRGRYMIYSLAELFVHFHRQARPLCRSCNFPSGAFAPALCFIDPGGVWSTAVFIFFPPYCCIELSYVISLPI